MPILLALVVVGSSGQPIGPNGKVYFDGGYGYFTTLSTVFQSLILREAGMPQMGKKSTLGLIPIQKTRLRLVLKEKKERTGL